MNYCLIKDAWGEDFCDSTKESNTYHIFEKPLEYIKKDNIEEETKTSSDNIQPNNINSDYFVYDLNNDSIGNSLQTDLDKKDKNDRKQYAYWYEKNKNDLEQQVLVNDKFRKNIKNILNNKKNKKTGGTIKKNKKTAGNIKKNKKTGGNIKKNKKTGGNIKKLSYYKKKYKGGNLLDFNKFYTVDYILLGFLLIFIIDLFHKIDY